MTVTAVESGASFERVLRALEEAGKTVRARGQRQASAQCPAHDDHDPSLSVTWRDGKTLLHCFSGCTGDRGQGDPAPVLERLGLAAIDLFDAPPAAPDQRQPRPRRRQPAARARPAAAAAGAQRAARSKSELLGRATGRWRVVAEYIYTSADGEPVGKVVRQQRPHERGYAKRFWQWHYIGHCPHQPCEDRRGNAHTERWGLDAPAQRVLYNLPAVAAAVAAGHEVWLVEGEKDSDALNGHFRSHGSSSVATTNASGGVSWEEGYTATLTGAHVVIVEDNDPVTTDPATGKPREPTGPRRTRKLLAELGSAAADVRVVRAKTGKDTFDHLAAGHRPSEFVRVPAPAPPAVPAGEPGAEGRRGHLQVVPAGGGRGPGGPGGGGEADDGPPNRRTRYLVRHGELVKEVDRQSGLFYEVVLGCTARILTVEQKMLAAGQNPATTGYLIEAQHTGGDPVQLRVTRKAWESGEWLHDLPWPDLAYESTRNGLARVRDAIRMTSPAARVAEVHGAPGWVTNPDGEWMFVHGGGAIGATGTVQADVDLPVKLSRYQLPDPPQDPAAIAEAAACSTGLLDQLPPRIGAVLAGLAYRSAISRMPPSVTLIGPPGSYKTSMGKVALHHFAPDLEFDESVLSLSERGATGNAGAKLMHLTRDVLLLADDAAPDRSLKAAAERVAAMVRLQYNGETRDRLDRDAEMQRPEPPRGSLLVSAEVGPSSASARQRTLLVPFSPGEISREARIALWEPSSRAGRAAVMASFLAWQAGRRLEVLDRVRQLTREYADRWHEDGYDERTAEALAHLAAGWQLMLTHLTTTGACTREEAAALWQRAWDGLAEAGRTQEDPDEPADPATRILSRLRTALAGSYGHLSARDGSPPLLEEAPRYGYTIDHASGRPSLTDPRPVLTARAGGDWVGCYEDADGQRRLYLMPELTLVMLRRLADRLGEPFEETVTSVGNFLHQAEIGLVTTVERTTGRLRRSAQHMMPGGKRRWVWDIPESALFGDDGGSCDPAPGSPQPSAAPDTQARLDEPAAPDPASAPPAGQPADGDAGPAAAARPESAPQGKEERRAPMTGWEPGTIGAAVNAGRAAPPQPPAARPRAAPASTAPAAAAPSRSPAPPASAPSPPAAVPAARSGAPLRGRGRAEAAASAVTDRWRAPAAVVHDDGLYLPGGEKLPLPAEVPHIGVLASLPARLRLGWGGGALPPAPGQLWLTRAFLRRAGLPDDLPEGIEDRDELLAQAAAHPFIIAAAADGWQISEASRTRLGHRMRIWSERDRAGAQIVFVPYISSLVHLLDGDPDPAALAQRLDLYARSVGVPYARSAAYSGHDLLAQLDVRRKLVLAGPAAPPPVLAGGEGNISFQRAPSAAEEQLGWVHSYDTTAQWLAASLRTKLGLGEARHADEPTFDTKLPGLWRVHPPGWDSAVPSPFASRRVLDDGTVWLPTPTLALAADPGVFGLTVEPLEAWVWPENTQYLDLWVDHLNKARLALSGPPPTYRPGNTDAAAVLEALKDTYSGAITLFGSAQLDEDPATGRARQKFYRPDWALMIISTARARLYRKIMQVEAENPGRWPLAIDRDNLLYASSDPDPGSACPAPLRLGHQLGAVKHKGSAAMSVAVKPLQRGRLDFSRLISPHEWDPLHGGARAAADSTAESEDPGHAR